MIFVTIGTQAPFDRFIRIIDELAPLLKEKIIAQNFKGEYQVKNITTIDFLPPNEFNKLLNEARLIISHAGMGSIISAMSLQKPIIIFPRKASLGEHRNDHQIATAKKMEELNYTYVAYDKEQLKSLLLKKDLIPLHFLKEYASQDLIRSISEFMDK